MERSVKGKRTLVDDVFLEYPSVYISYGEDYGQLYVNGEAYGVKSACGFRIDERDEGFRLYVYLEE